MKKLLRTAYIAPLLWAIMVSISQAESPNYNVSAQGMYSSTDHDDNTNFTQMGVGARYFLAPVNPNKGPLNEAEFLDRQSNLQGMLGTLSIDLDTGDPVVGIVSLDGDFVDIGFEFADQTQPFTAGVEYVTGSATKTVLGVKGKITVDITAITLGYFLDSHSAVGFKYETTTTEIKADGVSQGKYDADTLGVKYKNVMPLADSKYVNFEAGLDHISDNDNNSNNELSARFDYYFDIKTGLFGGLALNSGDDPSTEGTTLGLGAHYFVSPTVKLLFQYENFMAKDSFYDDKTIDIEVEARF